MRTKRTKFFLTLGSLASSLSLLVPTSLVLAQEAMSSNTYAIQSDSINFAGLLSESASYSLEDTSGEIATGNIASTNFAGEIGYQAMLLLVSGDTTPPSQPPSISSTPLTSTRVEVTWGESSDNVAVTRYYIYRDGARVADVGVFPRSFTDTGLTPDTLYSYNVSAVDDALNESLRSATTTARTLSSPQTPSGSTSPLLYNFSIIPTDTLALIKFDTTVAVKVSISWGTDTNYDSGTLSLDTLSSNHSFLLSGLSPARTYFLKINLTRQDGYVVTYEDIVFSTLQLPNVLTLPNVTDFQAVANDKDISLSWVLPNDPSIVGVKVLRSKEFYPSSVSDGELIFDGIGTGYRDVAVEKGIRYYYTIFTRDLSNNFSSGAVADVYILLPGEVFEPVFPLENIEIVGNVDPIIAALKLDDFLFIQDGKIISVGLNQVRIDGDKNFTVALQAYRVPQILKTIAVTLATQGENPKYFTFILKINKDGTRYEAVVAPLGVTRTYVLKITVIDFKNRGLKKLEGLVIVSSQMALDALNMEDKKALVYGVGFILVIILLVVFLKSRRGKYLPDKNHE
ncbi:MAG: hypothetical protein CO185_00130 [Candidatus Zambryskibacteria bacterium CG_4_9_14_3_um_filter_42_15]|uniref:Fibronectin type-III domain-containing protein n=1 Tax=Candidatus Zambryskibacteria bacterium CG_4_9_14_3_um_filter_42_15 TaxID=1975112 RepID=A0A2M7WT87_9BACT|nr:MAG: hypothetical protein CO185_00130 [Candidatus Zambryskibacteria bacterium CG_4_9_14_3_um_filter_42_15]